MEERPSSPAEGKPEHEDLRERIERRREEIRQRLAERRERHRLRPRAVRAGVVVIGVLVTLAGIVMTGPVPGPGILVIPVGLTILALEFAWAERLLERAIARAEVARHHAARTSGAQRVAMIALALIAVAAFAAAVILFEIPYLPG